MFRYIRTITICFFDILCAYFGWMIPFSRHPERYPLQYRYAKVRKLTLKVTKYMHVDIIAKNPEILKTPRTYVFIGNHTSMYDALIMLCLSEYPVSFVGKHEIRHMPFFGSTHAFFWTHYESNRCGLYRARQPQKRGGSTPRSKTCP